MASIKVYNSETSQWEVKATSQASELGVIDILNKYTSDNVEGALREIAFKNDETTAEIGAIKRSIGEIKNAFEESNTRIEFKILE